MVDLGRSVIQYDAKLSKEQPSDLIEDMSSFIGQQKLKFGSLNPEVFARINFKPEVLQDLA